MIRKKLIDKKGFTLVELMVAMVLSLAAAAAIFRGYVSFNQTADVQELIGEMHQNLRISITQVTKDLRMAGFDPLDTADAGFTTALGDPPTLPAGDPLPVFVITRDDDQDGAIDTPTVAPAAPETISYRLNGTDLERDLDNGGGYQTMVENIRVMELRYFDEDGNLLNTGPSPAPAVAAANLGEIRTVQVSVISQAGRIDVGFTDNRTYTNDQGNLLVNPNDNLHKRLITVKVQCRNMAYE